jgi:hypothetical protein
MRKELDDQLCRAYPKLYKNRHGDASKTCMHWGFSCGDGWYPLLDVLSLLVSRHDPNHSASQVKEKFGTLRYYFAAPNDYSAGVVSLAEHISAITCEICGSPAMVVSAGGWVSTRCAQHVEPHSQKIYGDDEVDSVQGLGRGWSRLVMALQNSCNFHSKHNQIPATTFSIEKKNGCLSVTFLGGNDRTQGSVDFINHYARRIDEHTGEPHHFS